MNVLKPELEISVGDHLIQTLAHMAFPPEKESRRTKEKMASELVMDLSGHKFDYGKPGVVYSVPYRFEETAEKDRQIVFTLSKEQVLEAIPELDPSSVAEKVDVPISYVDVSDVARARQVPNAVPPEQKESGDTPTA